MLHSASYAEGRRSLDGYGHSPEGVEKRAWILLNNSEEVPASNILPARSSRRPRILDALSDLLSSPDIAEALLGKDDGKVQSFLVLMNASVDPKRSMEWFRDERLGEDETPQHFEQQRGLQAASIRNIDNVGLVHVAEKAFAHMDSLQQYKDGAGNKCGCTASLRSELACRGAQGGINGLSEDPVLSALLHRFGQIETELVRRRSLNFAQVER